VQQSDLLRPSRFSGDSAASHSQSRSASPDLLSVPKPKALAAVAKPPAARKLAATPTPVAAPATAAAPGPAEDASFSWLEATKNGFLALCKPRACPDVNLSEWGVLEQWLSAPLTLSCPATHNPYCTVEASAVLLPTYYFP
jgi:hypothetical protein